MINQATLCLGLLNYAYFSPLAPILCLFKPKTPVCTLKMG
jgi:hypothetical protein